MLITKHPSLSVMPSQILPRYSHKGGKWLHIVVILCCQVVFASRQRLKSWCRAYSNRKRLRSMAIEGVNAHRFVRSNQEQLVEEGETGFLRHFSHHSLLPSSTRRNK
jgi:hypothetical protein